MKPSKAKPKVQTFGHEIPGPLDLDNHILKPPKAKGRRSIPFDLLFKTTPPI
jgi:hypothetical protein